MAVSRLRLVLLKPNHHLNLTPPTPNTADNTKASAINAEALVLEGLKRFASADLPALTPP